MRCRLADVAVFFTQHELLHHLWLVWLLLCLVLALCVSVLIFLAEIFYDYVQKLAITV